MRFDPGAVLARCGSQPDSQINLFEGALALSVLAHPGLVPERYLFHHQSLAEEVSKRFAALCNAGADEGAATRLAALKHILHDKEGYRGDTDRYDDLENADLVRVIDRRKGMPIALALLYIAVGRGQGWGVEGLNFPGHFLCRIDQGSARLIFNPFDGCSLMQAPELRALVKRVRGQHAELSADYYRSCTNREILIRLQNNIKLRQIAAEDYAGALQSVLWMKMIDPQEIRLWFDEGVLRARLGQNVAAIDILEKYRAAACDPRDRRDAQILIDHLRSMF